MRTLWVPEGNDPVWEKADAHGIDGLAFSIKDPRVTKEYLQGIVNRGKRVYVYGVSGWGGYGYGRAFAEAVNGRLLQVKVSNTVPRVVLDMEEHDWLSILQALTRWREIQVGQATSWTFESMQGGWMSPEFVALVTSCRVTLLPQFYNGAMDRQFAADVALKDLLKRGFTPSQVLGIYDARALPLDWDGHAYDQGRLP